MKSSGLRANRWASSLDAADICRLMGERTRDAAIRKWNSLPMEERLKMASRGSDRGVYTSSAMSDVLEPFTYTHHPRYQKGNRDFVDTVSMTSISIM